MKRLENKEVDKRLSIKLDRSIKSDENKIGVMTFGEKNDYPQMIERLINGSTTAKAAAGVYAKFLTGQGFEREELNEIIVGEDEKGKPIKLIRILREISKAISYNNGAYVHCNINLDRKVVKTKSVPFKYNRFQKIDESGYTAKIGVYENWDKDKDKQTYKKYNKKDIVWVNIFNLREEVFVEQVNDAGGIKKYKGQINFLFLDTDYLYPLSPIDQVYMDCDTEQQIQTYKNRTIRNGFFNKVLFRVQPTDNEEEQEELVNSIHEFIGPDGDSVLVLEDEIDEQNNEVKENGAFRVDEIKSNIDDKLFGDWEKSVANNIRKAYRALPAVLIDYEENKLGTTSGEAINQAVNFYNQVTDDDRTAISQFIAEIYKNFDNEILKTNDNWKIKAVDLYKEEENKIE